MELTPVEIIAMRYPARKKSNLLPVNLIRGEEWQQVLEIIFVSNLGRVKKSYSNKRGQQIEHLLRTQIYNGHLYTQYREPEGLRSRKLARIVLKAFKPLPDYNGMFALHLDCDPLNCQLKNLKWATLSEIHQHLRKNKPGRYKPVKTYLVPYIRSNGKSGFRRVKISPNKVAQVRKLNGSGISQSKISEITGIRQSTIKNIVNGFTRKQG